MSSQAQLDIFFDFVTYSRQTLSCACRFGKLIIFVSMLWTGFPFVKLIAVLVFLRTNFTNNLKNKTLSIWGRDLKIKFVAETTLQNFNSRNFKKELYKNWKAIIQYVQFPRSKRLAYRKLKLTF